MILTRAEEEQMLAWIVHMLTTRFKSDQKPKMLGDYIKSLVLRDATKETMISSLSDFMGSNARPFVELLLAQLNNKDFYLEGVATSQLLSTSSTTKPPRESNVKVEEKKPDIIVQILSKPVKEKSFHIKNETNKESSEESDPSESSGKNIKKIKQKSLKGGQDDHRSDDGSDENKKPRSYSKSRHHRHSSHNNQSKSRSNSRRSSRKDKSDSESSDSDDSEQEHKHRRHKHRRRSESKQRKSSEEKSYIDTEFSDELKEIPTQEKYILFIAGLEPNLNKLTRLFRAFNRFGKILAVEECPKRRGAFIQFADLSSAYRAVNSQKPFFGNPLIKVDYAVPPNPEAIAAIKAEQERMKQLALDRSQGKQQDAAELLDEMIQTLEKKIMAFDTEEDLIKKEQLKENIDTLSSMVDQLAQDVLLIS